MFKWWLEERYVSRDLGELYIVATNEEVAFSLVKRRNNETDEFARIDEIDRILGDDIMHCLCDEFLADCHNGRWDGEWRSIEPGTYIVDIDEECLTLDQSMFDGHFLQEFFADYVGDCESSLELRGFPRIWELFGFALSRPVRERVFEPAYCDLLECYFHSRQARYRTWRAQLWLKFCFTFRTFVLVIDCFRLVFFGSAFAFFLLLVPPAIRERLRDVWHSLFR